jgi:acetoin utilization protein AcuB
MLIGDLMRRDLVVVSPATTLPEAIRLTRGRGVRHLPVVDEGRLVGIVSDRDLKRVMASPATTLEAHELTYALERVTMAEVMTRTVITTAPMFPVEEAARIMVREKISALPVTEGGRLVGILTETDVLWLFVRGLGAGQPSSRLDVVLPARDPGLGGVVRAVERAGARILGVMTLVSPEGLSEVIVRIGTIDPGPAVGALREAGYVVRDVPERPAAARSEPRPRPTPSTAPPPR